MSRLTLKEDGTFVLQMVNTIYEGTWVLDGRRIKTTNHTIRENNVVRKDGDVHEYAISRDHTRLDAFAEAPPSKGHKLYFIRANQAKK